MNDIQTNVVFKRFLDGFIETIVDQAIDCIFISGDLAFSGVEEDYNALNKLIIDKISDKGKPKPLIIGLPGNHDVFWPAILNSIFDGQSKDIINRFNRKNETFSNNYRSNKEREALRFTHFSNWQRDNLKNITDNGRYRSSLAENKFLFGYLEDTVNKVVFIVLNSAWLSLGGGFDAQLREVLANNGRTHMTVDELISIKNSFVEFGGQIIGSEFLDDLANMTSKWTDYVIVTSMHHPLHWLDWSEYNSYRGTDVSRMNLYTILSNSDVFITGHEHSSEFVKPRRVNFGGEYDTLYIQSGMFLQDFVEQKAQLIFPHSRFSILDITPSGLNEIRYLYSNENQRWVKSVSPDKDLLYKFGRGDKTIYRLKDPEQIKDKFWRQGAKVVSEYFEIPMDYLADISDPTYSNFQVYGVSTGTEFHVTIVPKVHEFYVEVQRRDGTRDEFFRVLEGILKVWSNREGKLRITFFILDLLADDQALAQYSAVGLTQAERKKALELVRKRTDYTMDMFRVVFFQRVKDSLVVKKNGLNWWDISLANAVKPFWRV